jgi:hypothetical protein
MNYRKTLERTTTLKKVKSVLHQLQTHNADIGRRVGKEAPGDLSLNLRLDAFELRDVSKMVREDAPSFADALVEDAIRVSFESGRVAEREHVEITPK